MQIAWRSRGDRVEIAMEIAWRSRGDRMCIPVPVLLALAEAVRPEAEARAGEAARLAAPLPGHQIRLQIAIIELGARTEADVGAGEIGTGAGDPRQAVAAEVDVARVEAGGDPEGGGIHGRGRRGRGQG